MRNAAQSDEQFSILIDYLRHSRGFDFRGYKRSGLMRRMGKRMQLVQVESFEEYVDYLEVHPEEFPQLFDDILINVTTFFRDAQAWKSLATHPLWANPPPQNERPIRVWSAGCASGEEAYSLAIILAEALGPEAFRRRVKIYATDIDEAALTQARQATYSRKALQALSPALRKKYFEPVGTQLSFRPELRRSLIFGRHDLLTDAPISRLDLIVCRNTFMYFNAEAQARILNRFHFALNEQGLLFLGRAEMLLTHADLFTPVVLKHRIFSKVARDNLPDRFGLFHQATPLDPPAGGRHTRLREAAFEAAPVALFVLDTKLHVLAVNRRARLLFGLDGKDIGRPFQDLEVSYRPVELRPLIADVLRKHRVLRRTNIQRVLDGPSVQYLEVEVAPVHEAGSATGGVSIAFADVTPFAQIEQELRESKQEVETAYEELQSTNEEMETTNEELQSTVEELETTNEELQSTNEEMETMNEELQSTNEELQTVNVELRQRTDELHHANTFLQAILSSLRVGVAVLDQRCRVYVWNRRAQDLWGLQTEEVVDQSFWGLDIGLPLDQLRTPVRECLKAKRLTQEVLLPAVNRRGRHIQCRVAVVPLQTAGTAPQGVILLMEEVEA